MKSQQEMIRELELHGIKIEYKPVALVPEYNMHGEPSYGVIEMSIHDAYQKLTNRRKITIDPFSKK